MPTGGGFVTRVGAVCFVDPRDFLETAQRTSVRDRPAAAAERLACAVSTSFRGRHGEATRPETRTDHSNRCAPKILIRYRRQSYSGPKLTEG
jgi:hypothetical protein